MCAELYFRSPVRLDGAVLEHRDNFTFNFYSTNRIKPYHLRVPECKITVIKFGKKMSDMFNS
jgi:hypothetical protein